MLQVGYEAGSRVGKILSGVSEVTGSWMAGLKRRKTDLLGSDSEKGDSPRIRDECGSGPDEGDGCCKWNMMQESK
jgi:hypothetical protein